MRIVVTEGGKGESLRSFESSETGLPVRGNSYRIRVREIGGRRVESTTKKMWGPRQGGWGEADESARACRCLSGVLESSPGPRDASPYAPSPNHACAGRVGRRSLKVDRGSLRRTRAERALAVGAPGPGASSLDSVRTLCWKE